MTNKYRQTDGRVRRRCESRCRHQRRRARHAVTRLSSRDGQWQSSFYPSITDCGRVPPWVETEGDVDRPPRERLHFTTEKETQIAGTNNFPCCSQKLCCVHLFHHIIIIIVSQLMTSSHKRSSAGFIRHVRHFVFVCSAKQQQQSRPPLGDSI